MTPPDLAELLRGTAATVLAERGLDTSVLPDELKVERPRNPEHGDYATNIAMRVESANAYVANAHPDCLHDCIFLICDDCGKATHLDDDRVTGALRAAGAGAAGGRAADGAADGDRLELDRVADGGGAGAGGGRHFL